MKVQHHPGEAWLLDFALGNLAESFDTIIAAHVGVCAQCRAAITLAEVFGGELLAGLESAPLTLAADAIPDRYEAADSACLPGTRAPAAVTDDSLEFFVSTYLERSAAALPWRRIGHGLRICRLGEQAGLRMWMLRAAPGTVLPRHRHAGSELTLVVKGAYFCGSEIYRAGDVEDADEETLHQPMVTGDGECICLAVTEGNLRFEDWLPRLMQPFIGI
jgi:putative transcriptional regulator